MIFYIYDKQQKIKFLKGEKCGGIRDITPMWDLFFEKFQSGLPQPFWIEMRSFNTHGKHGGTVKEKVFEYECKNIRRRLLKSFTEKEWEAEGFVATETKSARDLGLAYWAVKLKMPLKGQNGFATCLLNKEMYYVEWEAVPYPGKWGWTAIGKMWFS